MPRLYSVLALGAALLHATAITAAPQLNARGDDTYHEDPSYGDGDGNDCGGHDLTCKPNGPCLLVNPLCQQRGLNVDYYHNDFFGYSRRGAEPSSYYITEGLEPLASSTTDIIYFPSEGIPNNLPLIYPNPDVHWAYAVGWERTLNGDITVDANNFTLVYQGYYRAAVSGTHTFCAYADNENDFFFGCDNAFKCIGGDADPAQTPLIQSFFTLGQDTTACADVDLIKGLFYPIRSVMGNYQGAASVEVTVKEPGAAEATHDFTGKAYQVGCGLLS